MELKSWEFLAHGQKKIFLFSGAVTTTIQNMAKMNVECYFKK